MKHLVKPIACGLVAGAINGFFGGGAGLILVPMLEIICKIEPKKSHATSVAVTFVLSLATFLVYLFRGGVTDLPNLWVLAAGSTAGGLLGGLALKKISAKLLQVLFALFLLYSGVRMLVG